MGLDTSTIIDGKYQIVRLLGEGGMGAVYEGLNTRIHRRVAIKVLHGNVAGNTDAVQRFEREAQAAGRIGSKHIVEVLDMGDLPSGDRYMVMEFLAGQSLSDRIRERGQMSPQELCPIVSQLLEGLAAAHAAGIVHRDLKPDNVFLLPADQQGHPDFVKILDFGISKFNVLGGEFSMTRTGAVMGTPYYMSPEQAKGDALDTRTDLYAVGVILYESLSGRVPFNAETFNQLLFKIVLEEAPPLEDLASHVNPAFIEIVRKAMARDPNARYQTASDFKAALQLWSKRDSILPLGIPDPSPGYGTSLPAKTIAHGVAAKPVTTQSWSKTGAPDETPALPKKKSLLVPIAAAALVVLGAGGFILKSKSDTAEEESAAAVRAEADKKADEERRAAALELEAQKKAAEEAAKKLEQLEREKKAEAEAAAAKAAAAPKADPKTTTAAAAAQASAKAPVRGAAAVSSPAPTEKKPAAATSSGTTTSTGRSIRSTL